MGLIPVKHPRRPAEKEPPGRQFAREPIAGPNPDESYRFGPAVKLEPLSHHRHRVTLGQPLPFGIRDAEGRLLLARDQVIETLEQLEGLLRRGTYVDGSELDDPAAKIRDAKAEDLPQLWTYSLERMGRVLRGRVDAEFHRSLESAAQPVLALVRRDPDMAIMQVVRQDDGPINHYASRHAVHAAVAGQLAAKRLGWGDGTAESLFRAALTMNLSMAELQDKLSTQLTPLTTLQRQALHEHPERSAELLQTAGVADVDWLAAVRTHHEKGDGKGYPKGTSDIGDLAMLLHRADAFTAKFSPRATRGVVAPDQAARQFFQSDPRNPMTAAIIKEFGIYPPGCAVRLKSGETGIVMRRGALANAPIIAVVTDRNGDALLTPQKRDSAIAEHAVAGVLAARALKVRVRMEALVKATL